MQYVVLVSEDPSHKGSYDDPEVYGPFDTEGAAKDCRKELKKDLPEHDVTVLPLKLPRT